MFCKTTPYTISNTTVYITWHFQLLNLSGKQKLICWFSSKCKENLTKKLIKKIVESCNTATKFEKKNLFQNGLILTETVLPTDLGCWLKKHEIAGF